MINANGPPNGNRRMKSRFQSEWANLGRKANPPPMASPKRIIRILDLKGFRALEDKHVLFQPLKGPVTPGFEEMADVLSEATFGIIRAQTEYQWPPEYYDMFEDDPARLDIVAASGEHEKLFGACALTYDEKDKYLSGLGWDFTDQMGNLLRITDLFCRQAEYVSKGLGGRMPDTASLGLDSWAADIERDARKFKQKTRAQSTGASL